MSSRGLLVAAAVLAALVGLLYWSNRQPPGNSAATPSPTPTESAPAILTLSEGDINKVELRKKAGDQLVLARDGNGKWQLTAPEPLSVDESAVSSMLSTISSLNSDRVVADEATNPGRYGLAKPALEISITDKNNFVRKLVIGDDTPTGSGAYVQLTGDPRVFTIASFTKTSLDKGLNDLRDRRLITAATDKITRLQLILKGQTIEFSRDKQQWQILKPGPQRADGTKVDDLVNKVTDAKMEVSPSADNSKPPPNFASGSMIAIARVTTDSGTEQLEVRKINDEYYAQSSVTEGVYQVGSELGQALDKKLDDFRNKKIFEPFLDDPSRIQIHDGPKSYFLTKGGNDWWSAESKKYEAAGAEALVGKLRDLEATEFSNSRMSTPELQITITSQDGKRIEKVSLAKGDKSTLARREGESVLYALDEKTIEELKKLLSELKVS